MVQFFTLLQKTKYSKTQVWKYQPYLYIIHFFMKNYV